jgi:hypothetical protein
LIVVAVDVISWLDETIFTTSLGIIWALFLTFSHHPSHRSQYFKSIRDSFLIFLHVRELWLHRKFLLTCRCPVTDMKWMNESFYASRWSHVSDVVTAGVLLTWFIIILEKSGILTNKKA